MTVMVLVWFAVSIGLFLSWEIPPDRGTLRLAAAVVLSALWPLIMLVWAVLGALVWATAPFFEGEERAP